VEKKDDEYRTIDGALNASGVIVENAEHATPIGTFMLSDEVASKNMVASENRRRYMM